MSEWQHVTIFDKEYPIEKQAEGIAIQRAVAEGHCEVCGFINMCSSNENFKPPVFAWCFRAKADLLKKWSR